MDATFMLDELFESQKSIKTNSENRGSGFKCECASDCVWQEACVREFEDSTPADEELGAIFNRGFKSGCVRDVGSFEETSMSSEDD